MDMLGKQRRTQLYWTYCKHGFAQTNCSERRQNLTVSSSVRLPLRRNSDTFFSSFVRVAGSTDITLPNCVASYTTQMLAPSASLFYSDQTRDGIFPTSCKCLRSENIFTPQFVGLVRLFFGDIEHYFVDNNSYY